MTGTFVDYALPTAAELPSFETDRTETPSPVNSLGVKGVGEAGTIAALAGGHQRRDRRAAPARRRRTSTCRSRPMRVWQAIQRGEGRCAVIPAEFDYVAPDTPRRGAPALREGGEDAKLLAGGHSLLPLMKLRLAAPTLLVDLRQVPGLRGVAARERRAGGSAR